MKSMSMSWCIIERRAEARHKAKTTIKTYERETKERIVYSKLPKKETQSKFNGSARVVNNYKSIP